MFLVIPCLAGKKKYYEESFLFVVCLFGFIVEERTDQQKSCSTVSISPTPRPPLFSFCVKLGEEGNKPILLINNALLGNTLK